MVRLRQVHPHLTGTPSQADPETATLRPAQRRPLSAGTAHSDSAAAGGAEQCVMTDRHWPRLSRSAVDSVLDGRADASLPPSYRRLERVLASARAGAWPDELVGEAAAASAFRAASLASATPPEVPPLRRVMSRMVAVKLVAAAAILTGGGLATAAATGALTQAPLHSGFGSGLAGSGAASASPSPGRSDESQDRRSLAALCRAFLAMNADQGRRALTSPPFDHLAARVAGRETVDAYCLRVIGSAVPPDGPGGTLPPAGRPGTAGPPEASASAAPWVQPSGDPHGPASRPPTPDPSEPPDASPSVPAPTPAPTDPRP